MDIHTKANWSFGKGGWGSLFASCCYSYSCDYLWSEMTLNYRTTMQRYPNLNGGVGGMIHDYEIFFLLDEKTKSPPTSR